MSDPTTQGEPTMEEILASIRKIISEDETDETAGNPDADAESDKGEDVLELTERVEEEEDSVADTNPEPSEDSMTGSVLSSDEQGLEAASQSKDSAAGLISGKTKSGVTSAMSEFASALASERDAGAPTLGGGPTLDALVLSLLEPQLKAWLDENLEPLVERLVKEELKRMARRAEDV